MTSWIIMDNDVIAGHTPNSQVSASVKFALLIVGNQIVRTWNTPNAVLSLRWANTFVQK
jgi:hypothetical protein